MSGLEIIFSDAHYVAINKPSGLAAIPGRGQDRSAFEQLGRQLGLARKGETDPRLRLVHRIDVETSGVMLFARDRAAQQHVSRQFQNNLVQKQYLALVAGQVQQDQGRISAPIGRHPADRARMAVVKYGRAAVTEWRVERRYRGLALLRVFPRTGKTHQIRVHLASIGLPMAVDRLYNPSAGGLYLSAFKRGYRAKSHQPERPLIERLTLHAERLTFMDMGGDAVTIEAPWPRDLRAAVKMLGKYASG